MGFHVAVGECNYSCFPSKAVTTRDLISMPVV